MIETPVSFETAKLANKKGFKEPCLQYFSLEGYKKFFMEDGSIFFSTGENGRLILRPTQSLLQKWLRDIHKISIEIYIFTGRWRVTIVDISDETKIIERKALDLDSYEQALEYGLREALKEIE